MGDGEVPGSGMRASAPAVYEQAMLALRNLFEENPQAQHSGIRAVQTRSAAVDSLILALWHDILPQYASSARRIALVAVGGYGRGELFPFSDVDLMFLLPARLAEKDIQEPVRTLVQQLWDAGLRLSPLTRTLTECERFHPDNVEFTLALLDARFLCGDVQVFERLESKSFAKLLARDRKRVIARLVEVTRSRHQRYGDTLFHLEPNVKDCPGGLRDANLCSWLHRLAEVVDIQTEEPDGEAFVAFGEAREFLVLVRTFLHLKHQRDDNTLDWQAQDQAAAVSLGLGMLGSENIDAGYWMRLYFRHARTVERIAGRALEGAAPEKFMPRLPAIDALRRIGIERASSREGLEVRSGRIFLAQAASPQADPVRDPEVMLTIFTAMARTGACLSPEAERRLESALPSLSAHLEDGPGLWRHLESILTGPHAGTALRAMHALGILELLLPEFHAIDALVIRDAYHRYTVDEHSFVLIDTLHSLQVAPPKNPSSLQAWAARFASILRDLPHPGLLFLAALLHDTGKGHHAAYHAMESVRMAESVVIRLEFDSYESGLVLALIGNHLEMSAALRRDVFDRETVRAFASCVQTPEALRMLTLFTYADISAVHPDALTPWKAENLHYLYVATSHFLDRNIDDQRVGAVAERGINDVIHRVAALLPGREAQLEGFLAGLPQRYLLTRGRDEILANFEMASRLDETSPDSSWTTHPKTDGSKAEPSTRTQGSGTQLSFRYSAEMCELTLIGRDRPMLFADVAGALAAWGMNVVTADAFSNAHGIVVDTFRFTDPFKTLELNESERERFVSSILEAIAGNAPVDAMLAARRRARRGPRRVTIQTRIEFDNTASIHSTLMEVGVQDISGLLRVLSLTLAAQGCNIEVALVDTEGEMAVDVFYLTWHGAKLGTEFQDALRRDLLEAIEANAR